MLYYDKSGQLSAIEERHLEGRISAVVFKYFQADWRGTPCVMYNGFKTESQYTFTICGGLYEGELRHHPILTFKGSSRDAFVRELRAVLENEGFENLKVRLGKEQPDITFDRSTSVE